MLSLPPITRTDQEVPLYSPEDPALDVEAMLAPECDEPKKPTPAEPEPRPCLRGVAGCRCSDVWRAYQRGEDLDIGKLKVREGETATTLKVRALGPTERRMVRLMVYGASGADEADRVVAFNALCHLCARVALVSIDGYALPARENHFGLRLLPEGILDVLGDTASFVGHAIWQLSQLDPAKKKSSG